MSNQHAPRNVGTLFRQAAVLVTLLLTAAAPAQRFTIRDLGTLPGYPDSQAMGLSESGLVVGGLKDSSDNWAAFLWDQGEMSVLPLLAGYDSAMARAVNGQWIVGQCSYEEGGYTFTRGVRWINGVCEELPPFAGESSAAFDLNSSGYVVGSSDCCDDLWVPYHACLWTPDGTPGDLGTLGVNNSAAWGINDAGQIVGWSHVGTGSEYHAVLWQPGAPPMDLGTLGGNLSVATAISETGVITGYSGNLCGDHHAFVWRPESGMVDLGTLGGSRSGAYDINTRGWIVGFAANAAEQPRACLWIDGEAFDLNDMVEATGWDGLTEARSVNDRYQIVGMGYVGGDFHAFLLTPVQIVGDVDGDGDVDLQDLAALLASYGACVGDPRYNPDADFDDSGCVDLADLAALLAHYGE